MQSSFPGLPSRAWCSYSGPSHRQILSSNPCLLSSISENFALLFWRLSSWLPASFRVIIWQKSQLSIRILAPQVSYFWAALDAFTQIAVSYSIIPRDKRPHGSFKYFFIYINYLSWLLPPLLPLPKLLFCKCSLWSFPCYISILVLCAKCKHVYVHYFTLSTHQP